MILLVEDDAADAELTIHSLHQNNLTNPIQVASDGEEALDYLFARKTLERALRLVLLDLKLPKVDGLEVLGAIKGDSHLKVLPVVILTSSMEPKDLLNSYHLGVDSYIQKPVNFEEFQEAVKNLGLYWLLVNQAPPPANSSFPL